MAGRRLIWDEGKRQANLAKHGLDFANAAWVLDSRYRLDVSMVRGGETRTLSFSCVMDRLAVLLLVHLPREDAVRIISFRYTSETEPGKYHEWIEEDVTPDA